MQVFWIFAFPELPLAKNAYGNFLNLYWLVVMLQVVTMNTIYKLNPCPAGKTYLDR